MSNPSGSMTFNGNAFVIPDVHGQFTNFLDKFHSIHDVIAWATDEICLNSASNSPRTNGTVGLTPTNYPDLPKPELNSLVWAGTGATRFSYYIGLIPTDPNWGGSGSGSNPYAQGVQGSLSLNDGTNSITAAMYVLAFRPVTVQSNTSLIVLVDQRYLWQWKNVGDLIINTKNPSIDTTQTQGTDINGQLIYKGTAGTANDDLNQLTITWANVFDAIGTNLGTDIDYDSPNSGFLQPDVNEIIQRKYANAAVMLDAISDSVGQRIVCDLDGTVHSWDYTHNANTNFNDTKLQIAGGQYPPESQPYQLIVTFPRASWGHAYCDGDKFAITNYLSGKSGQIAIDSTCYAMWNSTVDNYSANPDNNSVLTQVATAIQKYYLGWYSNKNYDASWNGIKSWVMSGYDNYISYHYSIQVPNDRYKIPLSQDDRNPKEDTQLETNYYAFTTRALSLPSKIGTNGNLSQDPKNQMLDGVQWGTVQANTTPDNGLGAITGVTVDIFQTNANGMDIDTGIQVTAYDVLGAASIAPGTKVSLQWHCNMRKWLYFVSSGASAIVQIDGGGSVSNAPLCVWAGHLLNTSTRYTFCSGANFTLGTPVWLIDINGVQSLPGGSRWIAKMIGNYSIGADLRPLYALQSVVNELTRFELTSDLVFGVDAGDQPNAVILEWDEDAFQYLPSGQEITVYDFTNDTSGGQPYGTWSGLQSTKYISGYQGWCEYKTDSGVYEIVWMESQARTIRFSLRGRTRVSISPGPPVLALGISDQNAQADVLNWWDGRNPDPDSRGVTVWNLPSNNNPFSNIFAGPEGAVGLATWDSKASAYAIYVLETKAQFITGKLTTTFNQTTGMGFGSVSDFWGSVGGLTPDEPVALKDVTKIFTGNIDDWYQATYNSKDDVYMITWIQCPTS